MKKILVLIALFFGAASFALAQDADNDGVSDASDCAPTDPTKWVSVIYIDEDGDGYSVAVTGCWGNTFCWYLANGFHFCYTYSIGSGLDGDDHDGTLIEGDGAVVASGDADNDGEPDYTDPSPYNADVNHMTIDVCNGLDDNHNGIIDEDCNACNLTVYAGVDKNLYYGYAPDQCVTKSAIITNGLSPYSYTWTLDRSLIPGETMNGVNGPSVTVCLKDTAQLCITVTDAANCTASDCAMIFAEDVTCTSGKSSVPKVKVCHLGTTICVDSNAVSAHLAHGDYLGKCANVSRARAVTLEKSKTNLRIFPNPTKNNFTVEVQASNNSIDRILRIINISGQVVKEINIKQQKTVNLSIKDAGVYSVQLITGEQTVTKKLVVIH